jgi:hypothetical protein
MTITISFIVIITILVWFNPCVTMALYNILIGVLSILVFPAADIDFLSLFTLDASFSMLFSMLSFLFSSSIGVHIGFYGWLIPLPFNESPLLDR